MTHGKHIVCHPTLLRDLKSKEACESAERIWQTHSADAVSCPKTFVDRYEKIQSITSGKGGAFVYLVKDRQSQKLLIVKIFEKSLTSIPHEIYITCFVSLQNREQKVTYFPNLKGVGYTTTCDPWQSTGLSAAQLYPFMIMEYMQGYQPLNQLSFKDLSQEERLGILFQISHALTLAGKDFAHLDLHMQNILVKPRRKQFTLHWGEQLYSFRSMPIGILDFGWSTLNQRTQPLKHIRSLFNFPLLEKVKPNGQEPSTGLWQRIKRTLVVLPQDDVDFRYFRQIAYVLVQQDVVPHDVHSFAQLFQSDFFDALINTPNPTVARAVRKIKRSPG